MQNELLTDTEIEIIKLVACGKMTDEIALRFKMSSKGVDIIRHSIGKKLALFAKGKLVLTADITRFAVESGLIKIF